MEIGFMVEPQIGGTYADLLRLARWAEAQGFDSFARSDHYLDRDRSVDATDALTTLGGLAVETDRIRLTVLVSPVTFRHPGIVAKIAATLAEMSGDRFELGLGTGWMESEHDAFGLELPEIGTRFDRFEESLGYLWAAFGRSAGGYQGEHYRLADIDVLPRVGGRVPIIIGGKGPRRTPSLAGRFADEYNMFTTDKDTFGNRRDTMRAAAVEAGRDPDRIALSMVMTPLVGDDAAEYRDRLGDAAAALDVTPDALEDDLAARHVPHGTPDRVAESVAEIISWGVGRIYLQQFDSLTEIDLDRQARTHRLLRGI